MAEKTFRAVVGGVEMLLPTTYLCGLYEVVEVLQGTGYDLAPDLRESRAISLKRNISGFGIRLGEATECPNDVTILIPQVQFTCT